MEMKLHCISVPDPGMDLGLGVVVRTVAENGLASNNGVKPGDEIYQVGVVKYHCQSKVAGLFSSDQFLSSLRHILPSLFRSGFPGEGGGLGPSVGGGCRRGGLPLLHEAWKLRECTGFESLRMAMVITSHHIYIC